MRVTSYYAFMLKRYDAERHATLPLYMLLR